MNLRRPLQISLLAASMLIGSVALAQQGQQPAPAEDHGAHHGGTDQQTGQQAPGGGMTDDTSGQGMGGGMMGQGGMMGKGMGRGGMMGQDMGGQDTGGMMGCPMMGGMMGGGKGMKKGMGHGMMMHSVPMMEARLAYIKADLEITEAQMPAWDAYAEAVRARHTTMQSMHEDIMKAKESGSALERMDARIKSMETMLDGLKALKTPTEALYAVLSDEQKKKADQLLGGRCGMM